VAASPVPVVSGVGHETDFTIADFVADKRAPTPSAAAEIVSPDRVELRAGLARLEAAMAGEIRALVTDLGWELDQRTTRLKLASPRAQLANAQQKVDDVQRRLADALGHDLALKLADMRRLHATLEAVGPPSVLRRGYALVTRDADGSLVRSPSQVSDHDRIRIRVDEGSFGAEVTEDGESTSRSE
jgi:exodeoxyribonuclease VII large subunit